MATINWRTDPQLFDPKPVGRTSWLNVNELISQEKEDLIFLQEKNTLNLFPIMVRRSDFVRRSQKDRILARFPYIQLLEKEKEIVANQDLLIAEKLRDYFYKSDNRKILTWRMILRKNLARGFVPFPFIRCFPDFLNIRFTHRSFESARGEAFTIPKHLTKEIAYLCGIVNGDGNLQKYVLSIVDYSLENIKQLQEQFIRLFAQKGRIQYPTENSSELIITNKWVVRFFSFLTDQPICGKKYTALREPLLFKRKRKFQQAYWSGVMDADGSYINRNIIFTSTKKSFSQAFKSFLETVKIKSILKEREDMGQQRTAGD